jgi:hypothetical protein
MRNGQLFRKESTMTQLEKVVYTATAHTTRGRDGASRSDDGRLDVKVSSPGTPGTGTNAEMNHSPTAKLVFPRRRMIKSAVSSAPTWRSFLASSAVAGALGLVLLAAPSYAQAVPAAEADAVRPFRINVPEAALVDLRRRVAAKR